jgi:hypothetical protein
MEVEWEWEEWEATGPLHVDTTVAGWAWVAGGLDKEVGVDPQAVVMVVMVVMVAVEDPEEDMGEAEDDDVKP